MACSLTPTSGAVVLEGRWWTTVSKSPADKDLLRFALSAIPMHTTFTAHVVSTLSEQSRLVSALDY
jgi:hypothetical protein